MAVNKELLNAGLEKEKLIQEIIFLGILINSHTDFCVFVNYSGHVDSLEVEVAQTKEDYKNKVVRSHDYVKRVTQDRLQELKRNLLCILETGEIDVTQLNYDIAEVRNYKL